MGKRIEQIRNLSLSDWKILISSAFLLAVVAISLKTCGLKRTQSLLTKFASLTSCSSKREVLELQVAQKHAALVSIAANHSSYKANCLKQVLVLRFLLDRESIASSLHIGIRKTSDNQLDAHAWLECAGIPLINSENTLKPFSSIHIST